MDDLAVGETRAITDDAGNEIKLQRTEKGLEVEVEGGEITFIDGTEPGDDGQAGTRREIRVIKKKIDVAN